MRRKEREVIDDTKIDEIIKNSRICRVGFNDNNGKSIDATAVFKLEADSISCKEHIR